MKENCLIQINRVQTSLSNKDYSYTYRSRLGRLIISICKLIANEIGISPPTLPHPYISLETIPSKIVPLVESYNRILALARRLSQPSEPMDMRWTQGWNQLKLEIDSLHEYILKL